MNHDISRKKGGKMKKKRKKKKYRLFLECLPGFSTLGSTSSSTPALRSSSEPPLLCRVLRFLGGLLGSDSPLLRVTGAFRLFGRGGMDDKWSGWFESGWKRDEGRRRQRAR